MLLKKSKNIFFTLFFVFLFFFLEGYSQNNYYQVLSASNTYYAPTKFKKSDATLEQKRSNVGFGIGFPLNKKKDMISGGIGYEVFSLENNREKNTPIKLYNTQTGVKYLHHWNKNTLSSTFIGAYAFASDYKTSTATSRQLSLFGVLHYKQNEKLTWTGGVFYSQQPFGPWAIPIVGVEWKINSKLYFFTILFSKVYLEYTVVPKKVYAGIDISGERRSFVLSDYQGYKNSYFTSISKKLPYLPFNNTLFVDIYFKEHFVFFLKGGIIMARNYTHKDSNNNAIESSYYHDEARNSFSLKIGLAYRIRRL